MKTQVETLIIGGGISGLVVAYRLRSLKPNHSIMLVEKGVRTGGVIATNEECGFMSERGPHGFLDNCSESRQILNEIGLDKEYVKAPLIDFVRYVLVNGRLNLIPQTPLKILQAPLIPWQAKLRVLAELWQPVVSGEPTVAKWSNERFGPAILPYLDAVFTGTYAGDFDKLTIDNVWPGLRALEKKHGSVLRGMVRAIIAKKKERPRNAPFTMPSMLSFPCGMQRLPQCLTEFLTPQIDLCLNTEVTKINFSNNGWLVESTKGQLQAKNLVLAVPINTAVDLLQQFEQISHETTVPEAWLATVVLGFRKNVKIPPGFGYLAPEQEQRFALGVLFSSNMFAGRAPRDCQVIEVLLGGRRHPERLMLNNDDLINKAFQDVKEILDLHEEPIYSTVLRSEGGIPQLEKNYSKLLDWRRKLLSNHTRLHICGFGWDGIGLNDMIKHAFRTAEAVLNNSSAGLTAPEVKGVYF